MPNASCLYFLDFLIKFSFVSPINKGLSHSIYSKKALQIEKERRKEKK